MKKHISSLYPMLLLLVFALSPGLFAQESGDESASMSKGQAALYQLGFDIPRGSLAAPPFSLTTLDGETASLSAAKGKLLLLNLWATWCPPCRQEMPSMQKIYERFAGKNFEMYAVAAPTPPRETLELITAHVADNGFTFPVPIDNEYQVNSIYGTGSIPTTWIIDEKGNIIARLVGATDWSSPEIIGALEMLIP
ncbi:TlpA disulfide reductase family protein [Sediminispirochaeta smaragdinae]|nr:TlpA disulfide reductase family protein [Sediminispirochaeta smaragdinae]